MSHEFAIILNNVYAFILQKKKKKKKRKKKKRKEKKRERVKEYTCNPCPPWL